MHEAQPPCMAGLHAQAAKAAKAAEKAAKAAKAKARKEEQKVQLAGAGTSDKKKKAQAASEAKQVSALHHPRSLASCCAGLASAQLQGANRRLFQQIFLLGCAAECDARKAPDEFTRQLHQRGPSTGVQGALPGWMPAARQSLLSATDPPAGIS